MTQNVYLKRCCCTFELVSFLFYAQINNFLNYESFQYYAFLRKSSEYQFMWVSLRLRANSLNDGINQRKSGCGMKTCWFTCYTFTLLPFVYYIKGVLRCLHMCMETLERECWCFNPLPSAPILSSILQVSIL